jgi:hypothetical protein
MATLIDNPSGEWLSNEVYEIQQTDPVEGAGTFASYGGLGVSNYPHQQLANRTSYLYNQSVQHTAQINSIDSVLVKSGTFQITSGASGAAATPSTGSFYTNIGNTSFTFPASSPTGYFALFGKCVVTCSIQGVSYPIVIPVNGVEYTTSYGVNIGTIIMQLYDADNGYYSTNDATGVLVAGTLAGITCSVDHAAFFENASGYPQGSTISQITLNAGITGSPGSQFGVCTFANFVISLVAVPF